MLRRVIVRGKSMEPTLREGQKLLVDTLTYKLRHPRRGELAIFRHPHKNVKIIKRILGVNEAGDYFVVGDNREHSTDSMHYGFVKRENFLGRVLFSYSPLKVLK